MMNLFIASLAIEETAVNLLFDERLGIIAGSILSDGRIESWRGNPIEHPLSESGVSPFVPG